MYDLISILLDYVEALPPTPDMKSQIYLPICVSKSQNVLIATGSRFSIC